MRKKKSKKREIKLETRFSNLALSRFINYLMKDGKKLVAQKVVYQALNNIEKKTKTNPLEVFEKAIENTSPVFEVVSKRVGGANYQVPREVRPQRKFFLACKWIIDGACSVKGKPMAAKLAEEIIAAFNNEGSAIRKKQNVHKMAEANRAFAHFVR
ncbi:MAG: 30S ribosomal protein S7 [Candidatus Wolfebacteria bacterium GW2011_GWC1_43_10]|uniref:Small ribosomal subunit protein uS7 n=2 Tax=Candidatus Wolfeibacteriota TaxID=1752735 RepID=A0A0G1CC28_9BACT|nr:MAG: 30S ribosomal protein S7 [Candidatus Wolfebacteria bacterium GW2011_GWC1_43_10]KKT22713.1 MAG: 30S ribosomal protein S7 [Parcubacteria group bacterium GW2011_GWB1_43_8b]OGM90050.1 MAG: 30S ribosomal protein S7 [Candidatus Wolfebacteria bacterium GWA1_42_9]